MSVSIHILILAAALAAPRQSPVAAARAASGAAVRCRGAVPALFAMPTAVPLAGLRRGAGGDDCDHDGLTDDEEHRLEIDPCNADSDSDGVGDFEEVRTLATNPRSADSDSDGLGDFEEVRTLHTDPKQPDTDGDGLSDAEEVRTTHTDPLLVDTDADGLTDAEETRIYRTRPDLADSDGDGLSDGDELTVIGTDPRSADTDHDGLSDGAETQRTATDPMLADSDGDGASDGEEVQRLLTDPRVADSDGDSVVDGRDACPLLAGATTRKGCPAPPAVGTEFTFSALTFTGDECRLDTASAESRHGLLTLRAWFDQCSRMSVIVEGHAWREGAEPKNVDASERCARSLQAWLVGHGVDPNRIEATIGYGSRRQSAFRAEASSAAARPARRVILRVAQNCE